jgi:hypothetical protein
MRFLCPHLSSQKGGIHETFMPEPLFAWYSNDSKGYSIQVDDQEKATVLYLLFKLSFFYFEANKPNKLIFVHLIRLIYL